MYADEFADLLDKAPNKLAQHSMKDPLKAAAKSFGENVSENFQKQVDSQGNAWVPHSAATIAIHGPHPLLRLTWTMYAAAVDYENAGSKHMIQNRLIQFGIDGSEIPYAQRQNEGGGRVPQREYFYLSREGEEDMREVIESLCYKIVDGEILA